MSNASQEGGASADAIGRRRRQGWTRAGAQPLVWPLAPMQLIDVSPNRVLGGNSKRHREWGAVLWGLLCSSSASSRPSQPICLSHDRQPSCCRFSPAQATCHPPQRAPGPAAAPGAPAVAPSAPACAVRRPAERPGEAGVGSGGWPRGRPRLLPACPEHGRAMRCCLHRALKAQTLARVPPPLTATAAHRSPPLTLDHCRRV